MCSSPSPQRVEAPCAHYPACGGCRFQDLDYAVQVAAKHDQVRDALKRIGGIAEPPLDEILAADSPFFYRNKLEYSFTQTPSGPALGFHKAGRWDEVLEIEKCWLTTDLGNAIRNAVRDWAREEGLVAYDQADHSGYLRHLVVREGRNTGQALVMLVTAPGEKFERGYFVEVLTRFPEVKSIHWAVNDSPSEVTNLPSTLLWGDDAIEEELLGLRFRVRPNAFLQTNTEMAEQLYALAIEYAGLTGGETVYDLYCGTGTIGLAMARNALTVWGVEISEESVACAIENADLNQIGNAAFFAGNVGQSIEELLERAGQPDVVVVDPPRAGLAGKALKRTGALGASRIVYVSCNPTTLASDVKVLRQEHGYELVRARPVDMFPHTPHVETVALLDARHARDAESHAQIAPERGRGAPTGTLARHRANTGQPSRRRRRRRASPPRERLAPLPAGRSRRSRGAPAAARDPRVCASSRGALHRLAAGTTPPGAFRSPARPTSANACTSRIFFPRANACCEIPLPEMVRAISFASANVRASSDARGGVGKTLLARPGPTNARAPASAARAPRPGGSMGMSTAITFAFSDTTSVNVGCVDTWTSPLGSRETATQPFRYPSTPATSTLVSGRDAGEVGVHRRVAEPEHDEPGERDVHRLRALNRNRCDRLAVGALDRDGPTLRSVGRPLELQRQFEPCVQQSLPDRLLELVAHPRKASSVRAVSRSTLASSAASCSGWTLYSVRRVLLVRHDHDALREVVDQRLAGVGAADLQPAQQLRRSRVRRSRPRTTPPSRDGSTVAITGGRSRVSTTTASGPRSITSASRS